MNLMDKDIEVNDQLVYTGDNKYRVVGVNGQGLTYAHVPKYGSDSEVILRTNHRNVLNWVCSAHAS